MQAIHYPDIKYKFIPAYFLLLFATHDADGSKFTPKFHLEISFLGINSYKNLYRYEYMD